MTTPFILKVVIWGKSQPITNGRVIDLAGHFQPNEVEGFRRWLIREHKAQRDNVSGDKWHGYEIEFSSFAVGLTNGYGSGFKVYYRPRAAQKAANRAGVRNPVPG